MEASLKERIRELLAPILTSRQLSLFDIARVGKVVRITLDREDGAVSIDDCTAVSQFLSHALDVEDLIPGRYRLEVSSPGLDRPLRSPDEFRRFVGSLCRVKLARAVDGDYVLVGRIREVDGARITLETADGRTQVVEHGDVATARLEVEF